MKVSPYALRTIATPPAAVPVRAASAFTATANDTSGLYTATKFILTDTRPSELSYLSMATVPDAGVTITPTGSAPKLAWQVSDLPVGKGGQILVRARVAVMSSDTIFTNTATGEITLTNNSKNSATNVVVPRVQFAPASYGALENVGSVPVTVTLDGPNAYGPVTITVTSANNSAFAPGDYMAVNQQVVIAAGQTSANLNVLMSYPARASQLP